MAQNENQFPIKGIERRKPGMWSRGSVTVIRADGMRIPYAEDTEVHFISTANAETTVEVIHHGFGQKPEHTLTVSGITEVIQALQAQYGS